MAAETPQQVYSREHVLRVLEISERHLASWERQGLIPAADSYSFSDLIALRTLSQLRQNGVSIPTIRKAVEAVRVRIQEVHDPLAQLRIVSEGKNVEVLVDGQRMEALSGQLLLNFDREELSKLLSFPGVNTQAETARHQQRQRAEAEVLFQRAVEMEHTGAPFEEIVAAYKEAAELDPSSCGAYVNLGTVYFNARRWREAEQFYRKALEVNPDYALAHFNIGNLYDERGDRLKAAHHYQRAIALRPGYADAHYNIALLYQTIGQNLTAVGHWQTFLRLDSSSNWAQIARRELDKLRRATVLHGTRQSS